jgi:hypothetical protein
MLGRVHFASFRGVVRSMSMVTLGDVGMMPSLFMVTGLMMFSSFLMVLDGVFQMFSRLFMVVGARVFSRHMHISFWLYAVFTTFLVYTVFRLTRP